MTRVSACTTAARCPRTTLPSTTNPKIIPGRSVNVTVPRPAFDDVAVGADPVAELGGQRVVAVGQAKAQLSAFDVVAGEVPLGAPRAVGESDLEARRPEAGSGLRREFVWGGVGLEAACCR